jgi:hypothetical protein
VESILTSVQGCPADHHATLKHIGPGALLRLGAREHVYDDPDGVLMLRIGSERVLRKAIIKLTPADTYVVEVGHIDRRKFEWISEEVVAGICCDALAETLLLVHNRAAGTS